ncbi:hypothetical protein HK407_12g17910 [Ordospora pajunii]|uniref:uncharacterized protein n=1 Tax=Ordospora pajunii TaxID=3039483 RepID=UPI0029527846|nr:uncharacterized protein HK407_12g17910 [Ordospora pajunii]KAH9410659.1 hypothetical protein HK407_12g17910 [Ordospora pajunii]
MKILADYGKMLKHCISEILINKNRMPGFKMEAFTHFKHNMTANDALNLKISQSNLSKSTYQKIYNVDTTNINGQTHQSQLESDPDSIYNMGADVDKLEQNLKESGKAYDKSMFDDIRKIIKKYEVVSEIIDAIRSKEASILGINQSEYDILNL